MATRITKEVGRRLLLSIWPFRRRKGIELLESSLPEPDVIQLIGGKIDDKNWKVRLAALQALSKCNDDRILPHLIRSLNRGLIEERDALLQFSSRVLVEKAQQGLPVRRLVLEALSSAAMGDVPAHQDYIVRLVDILSKLGSTAEAKDSLKTIFRKLGDLSLAKYKIAVLLRDMGCSDVAEISIIIQSQEAAMDSALASMGVRFPGRR